MPMKKLYSLILLVALTAFVSKAAVTYTLHFSDPEAVEKVAGNYGYGTELEIDSNGNTVITGTLSYVMVGVKLKDSCVLSSVTYNGTPMNFSLGTNGMYQIAIYNSGSTNAVPDGGLVNFEVTNPNGVDDVLADDNTEKVAYNILGVRVDPKNLAPGLYIINGKKVYVK